MERYSNEVMQEPMRRVVAKLEGFGVELDKLDGLEFYAREGDWQTISYSGRLSTLHAWEIDPDRETALRRNLPRAIIRIGDSYELALLPEYQHKFSFINFDNPQVTFGPSNELCEHFEALPLVPRLMGDHGIIIFDVNYNPYNFDQSPDWKSRREEYYRISDTGSLSFDFIEKFYIDYFIEMQLLSEFTFIEDRHDGHFAYCVMKLKRK